MDPALRSVVDRLLVMHPTRVELDAIGEAIGAMPIDAAGIEAILDALEDAGRTVAAPAGAHGIAALRKVVPAARALADDLGRTARVSEIAARAGLTEAEVRQALLLAKVMSR